MCNNTNLRYSLSCYFNYPNLRLSHWPISHNTCILLLIKSFNLVNIIYFINVSMVTLIALVPLTSGHWLSWRTLWCRSKASHRRELGLATSGGWWPRGTVVGPAERTEVEPMTIGDRVRVHGWKQFYDNFTSTSQTVHLFLFLAPHMHC